MANISYDGQSFSIDGRRVWLVSGAIHYTRTPQPLWRKRIRAAKQAGLNCIETYVFWNAHEEQPGEFDFTGDLNLRRFIQIVGEEGLFCILRPGPYICAEWNFGGLPAWLNNSDGIKLRQANGPFLEASARYIGEVMKQVKDLQISSTATTKTPQQADASPQDYGGYRSEGGGPIILMQAENEWFCANPDQHDRYLLENVRHLRENGCTVPITNCNNLWQSVDGTIDTWNAKHHLASDMRQLAVVRPDAPRLVSELWAGWFDSWGNPHSNEDSAGDVLHRIASVLSVGAMFNLYMFHGGTNFAFNAGRYVEPSRFFTTSYDYDAPLHEAGGRGEKFMAIKRIATFASQFHPVFANLGTDPPLTTIAPQSDDHPPAVIHQSGERGDVVFILRGKLDKTTQIDLLLPDGQTLPVPLGHDRAAWLLLNTPLGRNTTLDYTNLRPFALIGGRLLVLFGPAGAKGLVSIDGSPIQINVPTGTGKIPVTEKIDGLTLVILNEQQVDAAYPLEDGLVIGAGELDGNDQPTPHTDWPTLYHIKTDGQVTKQKQTAPRKPETPKLTNWQTAALGTLINGTDPGYETIDGPASLETLGQNRGYGWYRVPVAKAVTGKVLWPESADRLHVYHDGTLQKILGAGPGADDGPTTLKANGYVTVLADNLGRLNFGQSMGEPKGVFGPLYQVSAVKLTKPKVTQQPAPDPFVLEGMVYGRHHGERSPAQALTWSVTPDGRKPMILDIDQLPMDCVVTVNGEPIELYSQTYSGGFKRIVLEPGVGPVKGGKNQLTLALYEPLPHGVDPVKHLRLYKVTDMVSDKRGPWSFCPWGPPADESDTFGDLPKTSAAQPAWFRASFTVKHTDVPLWLEPVGMSKGQVYLNGHNVGRYWVNTAKGKKVPPQQAYYLPEPWLNTDAPNELLLFDEHGKLPGRCRLVYNPDGPYG